MSEAPALWARLAGVTCVAASSLVLLTPPRPAQVNPTLAEGGALAAGVALFAVLHAGNVRIARSRMPPTVQLARAAVFVVLAANEETIWRRAVLGEGLTVSHSFALLVSSAGFAAVHRAGRAKQLVTGAAFGGVYLSTGSLLAAVSAHAVYNLLVAASVDAARARGAPVT